MENASFICIIHSYFEELSHLNSSIDGKTVPIINSILQNEFWSFNHQKILPYNTTINQYMIDGTITMSFAQKPDMDFH
jgi:hypothetical protein